jgi:two-component system, NarL family, nitrate/nitrite response regulator NarL
MFATTGPRRDRAISVVIVAEVRLYREGLAASLSGRAPLSVIATCRGRADTLATLRDSGADVVVVDTGTRDSFELIGDLRRESASLKILAFAVDEVTSDILYCAEAGATGYVTADASLEELVTAIECIAREELVCSPKIAATLFRRLSERTDGLAHGISTRTLTSRERQVLDFIRQGQSNKQIAQNLNIAEPTVKNHVHNLLEKLEVTTRAQAAARAKLPASGRRAFGLTRIPERETG